MRTPAALALAAVLLLGPACLEGGKVEAGREFRAQSERAFALAKTTGCSCVSGARCDSEGSGYPDSPWIGPARDGARCCKSSNCADGLACDPTAAPSICAPIDVVAEKETLASCASPEPKVWERACEAATREPREILRSSVGPNIDRVRWVRAADVATLSAIDRGVFLVLSSSGSRAHRASTLSPSIEMLRELLGRVPPSVEVLVAEKRCMAKELVTLLQLRCDERGDGEVAWVRRGAIVATTGYGFHPERIAPNTEKLLATE